jgi:hypothetical protein
MFQQAWAIEVVVLRTIGNSATHTGARKRSIVQVLPLHREWREVPVVAPRDAGAIGVRLLMTAGAIQPRHAFTLPATNHVRDVPVSIVSLLRVVSGSVTVDTTRMG